MGVSWPDSILAAQLLYRVAIGFLAPDALFDLIAQRRPFEILQKLRLPPNKKRKWCNTPEANLQMHKLQVRVAF